MIVHTRNCPAFCASDRTSEKISPLYPSTFADADQFDFEWWWSQNSLSSIVLQIMSMDYYIVPSFSSLLLLLWITSHHENLLGGRRKKEEVQEVWGWRRWCQTRFQEEGPKDRVKCLRHVHPTSSPRVQGSKWNHSNLYLSLSLSLFWRYKHVSRIDQNPISINQRSMCGTRLYQSIPAAVFAVVADTQLSGTDFLDQGLNDDDAMIRHAGTVVVVPLPTTFQYS